MRLDNKLYQAYKSLSLHKHQPASTLMREALEEYVMREQKSEHSIFDLKPYRLGKLLVQSEKIDRSEMFDEMIRREE